MADVKDSKEAKQSKKRKRERRSRNFVFTLNLSNVIGDTDKCIAAGDRLCTHWKNEGRIARFIYQLEQAPTTGMLHLQGYFSTRADTSFDLARTFFTSLSADLSPWIQQAHQGAAAWDYCQKPDTRLAGPWQHGTPPAQGRRSDLEDFVVASGGLRDRTCTIAELRSDFCHIEAKYMRYFDRVIHRSLPERINKTRTILCVGPAGTGKSYQLRLECRNVFGCDPFPIMLRDGVKGTNASNWFDGLDQHESGGRGCIIDELSPHQLSLQLFNQLADRYPLNVPVKGAFVRWSCELLLITTNFAPVDLYPQYVSSDSKEMVKSGVVDPSFYSRIDEHWEVNYHPEYEPDKLFTNRVECATNAIWTQIK